MPYSITETKSALGRPVWRIAVEGILTGAEAQELVVRTEAGGQYEGWSQLNVFAPGASLSQEARATYSTRTPENTPANIRVGLVMDSAVLRTTINFILRVNRNHKVRVFRVEAEALAWIDAELGAPS